MRSSWVCSAVKPGADADADADADESVLTSHRSALLVPRLMPILLKYLLDKVRQNCFGDKESKCGNPRALVEAYCWFLCEFLVLRLDDKFV